MFNYNTSGSYGYSSYPAAASNAPYSQQNQNLSGIFGNYQQPVSSRGYSNNYTQAPSSLASSAGFNYDYLNSYKPQSAENPFGIGNARMPNNAPVGFTSAGTLSSTPAALGNVYGNQHGVSSLHHGGASGIAVGTHYEGYDAAVFAAATSFLTNKNHGMSSSNNNSWCQRKHPDATFPKKRSTFSGHQTKDVQTFYCEVCKISCAGSLTYKEHLSGKNHKKRQAVVSGENQIALPKSKVSFRCDICDITCTGKDTYDAHVKGSKHQKTMALLKRMGKPLPKTEPTLIAPQDVSIADPNGTPIPTVGSEAANKPKIIGSTGTRFMGGTTLTSTSEEPEKVREKEVMEAALEIEAQVQPVGEEYVDSEYNPQGRLVQYHCRLCECSFTDPNAKAIHTKGRRHRLAYRAKVDPNLKVEMKNSVLAARVKRDVKAKQVANASNQPYFGNGPPLVHEWCEMDNSMFAANNESVEDRHVVAKYAAISIDQERLDALKRLVELIEKSLKTASDLLFEADFDKQTICDKGEVKREPNAEPEVANQDSTVEPSEESKENGEKKENGEASNPAAKTRVLKGLMRVGLLANNLLIKDDQSADLVVMCSVPPTKTGLNRVAELFPEHFDEAYKEKLSLEVHCDESYLLVKVEGFDLSVRVFFTSAALRSFEGKEQDPATNNELSSDITNLKRCLMALAEVRRAKWYQAKASPMEAMGIAMIVLRDIRQRVHTWEPLTPWMLSLLVQKALESFGYPMTPGDALRRVFETISSGILLNKRGILMDPCEKDKIDVMESLTPQQREDITSSAQHALRLIVFDQIEKVLDMDRLDGNEANGCTESKENDRKRPHESSMNGNGEGSKKEKLDVSTA